MCVALYECTVRDSTAVRRVLLVWTSAGLPVILYRHLVFCSSVLGAWFLCDPSSPDRLGVERPCGWWVFCYGAVFSARCVLGGGGFLVLLSTLVEMGLAFGDRCLYLRSRAGCMDYAPWFVPSCLGGCLMFDSGWLPDVCIPVSSRDLPAGLGMFNPSV